MDKYKNFVASRNKKKLSIQEGDIDKDFGINSEPRSYKILIPYAVLNYILKI